MKRNGTIDDAFLLDVDCLIDYDNNLTFTSKSEICILIESLIIHWTIILGYAVSVVIFSCIVLIDVITTSLVIRHT